MSDSDKKSRTIFCGNLSEKVTEAILYELFLQAGPLENVTIPKDKGGIPRKYAFITFKHEVSVPYTLALMNGITLYGKTLTLEPRTGAASEHNIYLEKLNKYRHFAHQSVPSPSQPVPHPSPYQSVPHPSPYQSVPHQSPYQSVPHQSPYQSVPHQSPHQPIPPSRNYKGNLHREPYDDQACRNDSRQYTSRHESQQDYRNQWNVYPSQSSHYVPGLSNTYPAQGRFQNSKPQVTYPYANQGNWQRNRR